MPGGHYHKMLTNNLNQTQTQVQNDRNDIERCARSGDRAKQQQKKPTKT